MDKIVCFLSLHIRALLQNMTIEQVMTHNVVVVFVLWSLTVINSVGSGNLLDLRQCSRQANQLWGKL